MKSLALLIFLVLALPSNAFEKLILSEKEWLARLSPEQYEVLRNGKTEFAFENLYWDFKEKGTYQCGACLLPVFSSAAKYDSGTGWPSFWEPIDPQNVLLHWDFSLAAPRLAVFCARCESHLGHVFKDGPAPTGKRYCMNSWALNFIAE